MAKAAHYGHPAAAPLVVYKAEAGPLGSGPAVYGQGPYGVANIYLSIVLSEDNEAVGAVAEAETAGAEAGESQGAGYGSEGGKGSGRGV